MGDYTDHTAPPVLDPVDDRARGHRRHGGHFVQVAKDAASAILAEGAVRLADVTATPSNAPAALGGGSRYAQGGALYWKGGSGKPTLLAPA
ncbi:hypothetical protein OHV08_11730 [Streptomyces canus]|uniref:hypothetical protein n=1 Tax=Streptomyces canus TaxID=58343 RepID=UPI00324E578D